MSERYETVIGLEVHSQLLTRSKMFCACSSDYQHSPPNTKVCAVCMGMPGVLPVVNAKAVEIAIKTGLALGCEIASTTKFDRKNYPYPDLMKGYQISQYDQPIAEKGTLTISTESGVKHIGITRVHLEEDVARLVHTSDLDNKQYSMLDINRAGVPLMEIVSEPDMRSPEEAHSYLTSLHTIVKYIGASTANMEEGSFRCDANISVRLEGEKKLGKKVEIKNLNSFRSVLRALKYEEIRQIGCIESNQPIYQETRGWIEETSKTRSQRTKEQASDYRYFPEPDIPPLKVPKKWVDSINNTLPELPENKKLRLMTDFHLGEYDARLLTSIKENAELFENVQNEFNRIHGEYDPVKAKLTANWINVDLARLTNEKNSKIESSGITSNNLSSLIDMIHGEVLTSSAAKTVFEIMFAEGGDPSTISKNMDLVQVSDTKFILDTISKVIEENEQAVKDYLNGKNTALKFMIGQVMKNTKGKANPKVAQKKLKETLDKMA